MNCPKCGTPNNEGVSFCAGCGSPLNTQPAYGYAPQPVQPAYGYAPQPASIPGKGLGITGMVLGIVSILFVCVGYVGIILAIVGAALSGVALSKAKNAGVKNGMATAGLVCSVITLALWIILLILGASLLAEMGLALDSMY